MADGPWPPWGDRAYVMGVINVTPDSFSGDGLLDRTSQIPSLAERHVAEGASVIDVGGESTRPGHKPVPADEEIARVVPVVRTLAKTLSVPISIDTRKAEVAEAALAAGASIVNDVSGLSDPRMVGVVVSAGAGLVIVHNGSPAQDEDILSLVRGRLRKLAEYAIRGGVPRSAIVVDPGLGIGKDFSANLAILRRLGELRQLELPVLVGPSRKGTIGRVLGVGVDDRLEGTAALVALSVANGADMVRVHDVQAMDRIVRMIDALRRRVGIND